MSARVAGGTMIIAEAGVNHNGDLQRALQLIDAAADAGADVVKFQSFHADRVVTASAPKADYQLASERGSESQQDMLRRLELTPAMHKALVERCRARGIRFLSTAFDVESLDLLAALGAELFKVPSGELTNLPYLRHVGRLGKSLIVSTGMSTLDEIGAALSALERAGTPRDQVTVLHCTTAYPAPIDDVNLRAMLAIRDAFDVRVGYSDHTRGIEVAIAAAALGADVIEKHLTLDRALPGPDHAASLEPAEFSTLVAAVRNVERALGDGVKRPRPSEAPNAPAARRSLVAACAIRTGDLFSDANITAKRPGTGMSPMRWDDVIGQTARRDYLPDEPIEL